MNILLLIVFIVFGLVFGSFFACIGYRIPNKISTIKPGSFCPKCKKSLKWYMNIPVFSYIFLGGKCYYCKKKISPLYIIIEISSAVLFALAYLTYINVTEPNYLYCILFLTLSSALLITLVSDFIYFYISDRVVLISLFIILVSKFIFLGLESTFYSLLSGVIMFGIMYLIRIIGNKLFNKESLGGGDIKLSGVLGCAIGVLPSLVSIFIASLTGLIYAFISKKDDKTGIVPFGPFLIFGSLICLYFYDIILNYVQIVVNVL